MLVTRSLRLAAARYSQPAIYVCPTMAMQIRPTTIRYTIPATVAYSKDTKSGGSLKEAGVKLPNKEEIESFVFKSLVYIWDFTYYVVCLCIRLIKAYVINNPTIQHFWKLLLKRMDDERKKIKSK